MPSTMTVFSLSARTVFFQMARILHLMFLRLLSIRRRMGGKYYLLFDLFQASFCSWEAIASPLARLAKTYRRTHLAASDAKQPSGAGHSERRSREEYFPWGKGSLLLRLPPVAVRNDTMGKASDDPFPRTPLFKRGREDQPSFCQKLKTTRWFSVVLRSPRCNCGPC